MSIYMGEVVREIRESPEDRFVPIRPEDIDVESGLTETFGEHEVERNAVNLIKFFQRRGGWYPFYPQELEEFCREIGEDPKVVFRGLMGCWIHRGFTTSYFHQSHPCIVMGEDGMYAVTNHFIKRCAGHYRGKGVSENSRIYYRVVIARGEAGGNIQFSYYMDAEKIGGKSPQDAAKDLAESLTREHGISPDSYWVAYVGRVLEQQLFRDPRLVLDMINPS